VHPKESLQAASAFFQTALAAMARLIEPGPAWLDQYMLIALALEESLTLRVRESVSSYTGFLLKQVQGAQVQERRRIARDLHDRIGNSVSVAHRQLELYELYRNSQPAKADARMEAAQRAIRESMKNLRIVASDLHAREPVQNLEKTLRAYLTAAGSDDVTIRLAVNGDETWAPTAVLDETLLIVREAAANALRYASASVLAIDIEITPDGLRASVLDDGCGFDTELVAASGTNGVGLLSMVERAELLEGTLSVRSKIGQGTQVDFWAPLKRRAGVDAE
jgi:signal transduction histidine kinase